MAAPITCLVTLHGIGFMQPPQQNVPGYADPLHEHLKKQLGSLLSDDPNRKRTREGENGAIYVQSRWLTPDGIPSTEEGLKRLGSWSKDMRRFQTKNAPLIADDARISHVALVYTNLEPQGPEVEATLLSSAMSLFYTSNYAHISGLMHMAFSDIMAIMRDSSAASDQQPSSLHPRTDVGTRGPRTLTPQPQAANPYAPGLLPLLRSLEDDVACYVCQNEERECVRRFVAEAFWRLASRDDVGSIVLNTHSNGTVIALDILRTLPPFATAKVKAFVTSGSPLRKYIDLFRWGQQIELPSPIKPWYNFWDRCDPVGDPLEPPISWHWGDKLESPYDPKLFSLIDPNSGVRSNVEITDIQIDNIRNSAGGGLQAHNYWDNEKEFVTQLSAILQTVVKSQDAQAAVSSKS